MGSGWVSRDMLWKPNIPLGIMGLAWADKIAQSKPISEAMCSSSVQAQFKNRELALKIFAKSHSPDYTVKPTWGNDREGASSWGGMGEKKMASEHKGEFLLRAMRLLMPFVTTMSPVPENPAKMPFGPCSG